ncbi:MAG: serine/threonine protein kinase, partial [Planctomycetes bacterium]|nr:serine/threonine protein kinase [Planctomycetota bacterium]
MSNPEPPGSQRASAVAVEFLQIYLEDQTVGRTRDLGDYQAMFPGHEAVVAAEFAAASSQIPDGLGPDDPELPGRAERYQLRGEIGRGGMGLVMCAYDPSLGRDVALKSLAQSQGASPSPRRLRRFLHEARVLARLQHPGIVTVHEVGVGTDGTPYFTMPLVEGYDLQRVVASVAAGDPRWPLVRAVGVLARVCEAVAHAHARGVVHRDLKPANVMVGNDGATYVVDWGLARLLDDGDEPVATEPVAGGPLLRTLDGEVIGTPAYMPPEQARGELDAIGPRSDVYALGAMLYHLLAGAAPFSSGGAVRDSAETVERVLAGPPRPLREAAPSVPGELVSICERAMARDAGDRYRSAGELADDLRAFLEGRVVSAHETGWWAGLVKWGRRNRLATAALLLAGGALVFGLVATAVQARETERRAVEADENFRLAIAAAEHLLGEVGLNGVDVGAARDPVRRRLLQKALEYYRRFVDLRGDDPRLRYYLAQCHLRMASLEDQLGGVDASRRHAERARDAFADIAAAGGDRAEAARLQELVMQGHLLMLDARAGEDVVEPLTRVADELLVRSRQAPADDMLQQHTETVLGNL